MTPTPPGVLLFGDAPPFTVGPCPKPQGPQKRRSARQANGKGNRRPSMTVDAPSVTPLYKTRLCNFHVRGACTKGQSCPFAHGAEDLLPSPDFEKTSVCPVMLNNGKCDKPRCRYAHSADELRSAPGLLKTKMCSFHLNGLCVVGEACRFAHTVEELREAVLLQKTAAAESRAPPLTTKRPSAALWDMRRAAFAESPALAQGSREDFIAQQIPDSSLFNRTKPETDFPTRMLELADTVGQKSSVPRHLPEPAGEPVKVDVAGSRPEDDLGPTQVISGRVRIASAIDDDDEDLIPVMRQSTPTGDSTSAPKDQSAVESSSPSADIVRATSAPLVALSAPRSRSLGARRVVVDIEDADAILRFCDMRHECTVHSTVADAPEAHPSQRRRRKAISLDEFVLKSTGGPCGRALAAVDEETVPGDTGGSDGTTAAKGCCPLPKSDRSPCSFSGRFSECALCPRGKAFCDGQSPCAACTCGLKVVARNTFLTIDVGEDREARFGARVRSKSQ